MEIDKNILNRFKIYESDLLFDIEKLDFFIALKALRCPKCMCKLKFMRNGKGYYCRSKKHRQPFFITKSKLDKINGE